MLKYFLLVFLCAAALIVCCCAVLSGRLRDRAEYPDAAARAAEPGEGGAGDGK